MFELREYQQKAKHEIRSKFSEGIKAVILCAPTGSGKTVTFASIAADASRTGTTSVIVVDRKELLAQSIEKLVHYGLSPSLITAGKRTFQSSVYVATVETLVRRPQTINRLAESKRLLFIIDECHKQSFDKVLENKSFGHAFFIGASATPKRSGKMTQLSKYYSDIVQPTTISYLIENGHLVPAITFGAPVDVSKIAVKRGEFDSNSMFNEFNKTVLYSGVVEKYRKHANGTRAICFCINVQHSINTRDAFRNAGIRAEHIDGSTPNNERNSIVSAYKNGFVDVLCNCEILTTGFDDPATETVIVNRATKSLTLWLQMCGRGSRPNGESKTHFNVLDLGGNVFRLGFWETEREFSLDHKTKKTEDAAPLKECPNCAALLHLSAMKCKNCGHVFEKIEKPLVESEFVPLVNQSESLPENLRGKNLSEMTVVELEQYREFKKYKIGWIVRQITERNDITLQQFADLKGYKQSWIMVQNSIYSKNG